MKNKKTIVAIIAVLLVVVVGVTFAYFQSTASFENLFNVGIYKVTTTEVFESPDNWAPGQEIPKTITTTNEGTIPAAVRVSYTEQWLDGDTDITSSVPNGTVTINLDNTSDWTKEGNYYYYNYILEPEQTTSSFMKSVTLSDSINGITCTPSNDGLTQSCESSSPIQGATYKLTITKETIQADRYQDVWNTNISITEKPETSITYLNRQVEGQITPGDVIGIGETEDFYVISSNAEKTVLLAKYNLLVGNIVSKGEVVGTIDPTTPGYGLQSVDATGYVEDGGDWVGAVAFSNTNYWMDGTNLLSPYNENNTIYYDNSDINSWDWGLRYVNDNSEAYAYIYDENSNLYQYISGQNGYVNRLIEMGAPSTITGRLLSHDELLSASSLRYNNESIIYYTFSTYWIGSTHYSDTSIEGVYCAGTFPGDYNDTIYHAIRPVIEIPTSELQ